MKLRILIVALCLFVPLAARAGEASPSHVQAAEELFRTMKIDTLLDQAIDTILKAQAAQKPEEALRAVTSSGPSAGEADFVAGLPAEMTGSGAA